MKETKKFWRTWRKKWKFSNNLHNGQYYSFFFKLIFQWFKLYITIKWVAHQFDSHKKMVTNGKIELFELSLRRSGKLWKCFLTLEIRVVASSLFSSNSIFLWELGILTRSCRKYSAWICCSWWLLLLLLHVVLLL